MSSSVGSSNIYQANDQKEYTDKEIKDAEKNKESRPDHNLRHDIKPRGTIDDDLARQEKRYQEPDPKHVEQEQSKKDSTLPATTHGNEPSKGAKIDQELREEDEEAMKKKGTFGPKK